MAQMKLEIGGRSFMVTCQDGEESHLNESRMLLFTSLLLADELHSARAAQDEASKASAPASADPMDEQSIAALEKLADRAEQLANSLE